LAYIVAMLLVFVALVSLVNQVLAGLPEVDGAPLSLWKTIMGESQIDATHEGKCALR
jgi:nucleoside permease NupC